MYRPRKPVAPNTVAVTPLIDALPPGPARSPVLVRELEMFATALCGSLAKCLLNRVPVATTAPSADECLRTFSRAAMRPIERRSPSMIATQLDQQFREQALLQVKC
mmetsp:Transcript_16543/g.49512  ORF Transcript_16543/g.49512 Transcript_16543/m.49512 type:complete len:106 (+) Transcript_16543:1676-1993(+)